MIPLFDSLTHPMPDGSWLHPRYDGINTFATVLAEMAEAGVSRALAVALGSGTVGYHPDTYANLVKAASDGAGTDVELYPVAYAPVGDEDFMKDLPKHLDSFKAGGYIAVKIHPRISDVDLDAEPIRHVMQAAASVGLPVLLCCYFYGGGAKACKNSVASLQRLLPDVPNTSIVLLHAGVFRCLEVAELARHHANVLVDLSYTLCKYPGASLDLDLAYLFRHFDQRICVGSDHPEFSMLNLRERFEQFSDGLDVERKERIAYKNLLNFLGLS